MKSKIAHIISCILLSLLLGACSTPKNTAAYRNYLGFVTRYNVFFNGNESYKEGLIKISEAHKDDYSNILPMYPISVHSNASAGASDMEKTVEKAQKATKQFSLRRKPKKNPKKARDPKYQALMSKEEYNPLMGKVWLLMGKGQFHKAEFLDAVGIFSYTAKYFAEEKDVLAEAQIWLARTYAEMGWNYEAEDMLNKANKGQLSYKLNGLFAAASADLLLKEGRYKEAIPFLELALKKEKNKRLQMRFAYILAQLYEKDKNGTKAYGYYSEVISKNPPVEMEFNARLNRTKSSWQKNTANTLKDLDKMLKRIKFSDYRDQVYYAIGSVYEQKGDTALAIKNYSLAVSENTRGGIEKATSLIALGDLYYATKEYVKAEPNFSEAASIMSNEHIEYGRVSNLAEMLGELVIEHETVVLQDSLQRLAKLPKAQQEEVVMQMIKRMQEEEKALAEKQLAEERRAQRDLDAMSGMPSMGFNATSSEWYFYNPQLINRGAAEFQKKWGSRKLEDNWRRSNKSTINIEESEIAETDYAEALQDTEELQAESASSIQKPEYYLKQIPNTESQLVKSDEMIASALFNMGLIYKDKLGDVKMAIQTFEELERRFPSAPQLCDAYFFVHRLAALQPNDNKAEIYRNKVIRECPKSKYAMILSQPDYAEKMAEMYLLQDSLYRETYLAYTNSDFQKVNKNYLFVKENYPLSNLMPKFMLLDALSAGKTRPVDEFEAKLKLLVEDYPDSDVSSFAKDILALMSQGEEAQQGTAGSLAARREELKAEADALGKATQFDPDKKQRHLFAILLPASQNKNKLLYDIASYNFTGFLIKDFDLNITAYDENTTLMSVSSFENFDEAAWYEKGILADASVGEQLKNAEYFVISEANIELLKTTFTKEQYLEFLNTQLAQSKAPVKSKTTPSAQPVVELVDVTKKAEAEAEAEAETESETQAQTQAQKPETLVKYKNLYTYNEAAPHTYGILLQRNKFDYPKTKEAFDKYNAENYAIANLNVTIEAFGAMRIIYIGAFPNGNAAKSYLLRAIKEPALYNYLKDADYRNLIGTPENFETLKKNTTTLPVFMEFMREFYLK